MRPAGFIVVILRVHADADTAQRNRTDSGILRAKLIGLTINHENMSNDDVDAAIATYAADLKMPSTDALSQPYRASCEDGCGGLPGNSGKTGRGVPLTAPRLEINLQKIQHNATVLVRRLARKGIAVSGVTKATLGCPRIASAMLKGGVQRLADSRIENIEAMRRANVRRRNAPHSLAHAQSGRPRGRRRGCQFQYGT